MNRPDHLIPSPLESAPLPAVTNHTAWPSQYFQHVDPRGEIFHVMVCRTSYRLSGMDFDGDAPPTPTLLDFEEQAPLCESDTFCAGANTSSVLQESDFAPFKPRCDVVVINAQAHSPENKPMSRWAVGFGFGEAITKAFQVSGPRYLEHGWSRAGGWRATDPELATTVPLRYEYAFGGPGLLDAREQLEFAALDPTAAPEHQREAREALQKIPPPFLPNPIGCGNDAMAWVSTMQTMKTLFGANVESLRAQAPRLEVLNRPYRGEQDYPVVGLGPIGRWWQPRLTLAGTHDQNWQATQWPKSPLDHDYRYWNCAPEDQQIDYPVGGETISLINLTPGAGLVRFLMPRQDMQLLLRLQMGAMMFTPMNIDTVIIDIGNATLSVVRRALVSSRAEVRAMELGTWPHGTRMEQSSLAAGSTSKASHG